MKPKKQNYWQLKSSLSLFLKIYHHGYVKGGGFIKRRSSKQHTVVTGNAKKGVPKFICKAWMVMSAAQTGLKPTTVTCEMRICGDWTGLNASVKLLSRAYLQRMWEAWQFWGGRTKPACMYIHCSLRARQLHSHQASSAYISKELTSVTPLAVYQWMFVMVFIIAFTSVFAST